MINYSTNKFILMLGFIIPFFSQLNLFYFWDESNIELLYFSLFISMIYSIKSTYLVIIKKEKVNFRIIGGFSFLINIVILMVRTL
ncbi:membrane protein of unknown function (plasmid) [Vibrio harveyi]|nr:membrane protein of unknown function [Vibrio harveyi]